MSRSLNALASVCSLLFSVAAYAQTTPAAGGYTVQISSQRNEAAALASYQALQKRFPNLLSGRSPITTRLDSGGAVFYRVAIGPFPTADEASQFCSELKAAGGICFVQIYRPPSQ